MQTMSPFRLMHLVFYGFAISFAYGLAATVVVFFTQGSPAYQEFWEAYTTSFNTLISLGLILGSAVVVYRTQDEVPACIQKAFNDSELSATDYFKYRKRYVSRRRSVSFSAEFVVVAFVIFSLAHFPESAIAEKFLLVAACTEYALGVYVGRKLIYAGMMLHSLQKIPIQKNLFASRALDGINSYVNIVSTLTIIFSYIHVRNYYNGPFLFDSFLEQGIRPLLLLPAIIAAPVLLIFNFYPRIVLRKIYSESIDVEIETLQERLRNENLSMFERESYIIAFDKMSRDELRYRLRLTLSDLPIGITILIMVLGPLLTK
jgi:hypothetical protein